MDKAEVQRILEITAEKIRSKDIPADIRGEDFETIVYETIRNVLRDESLQLEVQHCGPTTFPDLIIDNNIGVEIKVKTSSSTDWKLTGNSINFSTLVPELDSIFLFACKTNPQTEIKIVQYEDAVIDIQVTHMPRFILDPDNVPDSSIFSELGATFPYYDAKLFLKDLKRKYVNEGKTAWWIDQPKRETSAVLRRISEISYEEQIRMRIDGFIYFPELFGDSRDKFNRVTIFFLEEYNVLNPSMRDFYTAGGRQKIQLSGKTIEVAQIIHRFWILRQQIRNRLLSIDKNDLELHWGRETVSEPIEEYCRMIKVHSKKASEVIWDCLKSA